MRRFARDTTEHVVEALGSNQLQGLNSSQVASLRKAHGLNKLEEEEKVRVLHVVFDGVLVANSSAAIAGTYRVSVSRKI
jgi:magnesium-transporting ATPase (P-type)